MFLCMHVRLPTVCSISSAVCDGILYYPFVIWYLTLTWLSLNEIWWKWGVRGRKEDLYEDLIVWEFFTGKTYCKTKTTPATTTLPHHKQQNWMIFIKSSSFSSRNRNIIHILQYVSCWEKNWTEYNFINWKRRMFLWGEFGGERALEAMLWKSCLWMRTTHTKACTKQVRRKGRGRETYD